jgi:hypothetical protein
MLHLQWLLGIGYELQLLSLWLVPVALSSFKADLPFNRIIPHNSDRVFY